MIANKYYEQIPGAMMDFEDFYLKMAQRLPDNCTIAEVGVAEGRSGLFLAYHLTQLGKKFTFYFIDSLDYGGRDQLNTIINNVIKSGIEGISIFPFSSLDASCRFPDNHFDFVFLDSSHTYMQTKAEIKLWFSKVKHDGILAGHDYIAHNEVRMAVDEVVPTSFTRDPIKDQDQVFKPEIVLRYQDTAQHFGVWWFVKKWWLRLNP